jgi:3-hydroxybutyryl-CoA dehydrogenase
MLRTLQPGALAWPRSAAIIGGGTMGSGVAESWLAAGVLVRLVDRDPEQTRQTRAQLARRVRGHVEAGLVDAALLERVEAMPAVDDIAAAVDGADLVFEAVWERIDVKRDALAAIEAAAPADALIASNTSSLPIDDLAALLQRPRRFLGMHWFNPPEWIPGVELIPARVTDAQHVERARDFLAAIGKRPIVVGSGPGFVANRLQMALFREALACVEDGLATPEAVDEVARSCFGFRLPFFGPLQIADMAGLDVYGHVFGVLERGLGERFRPPEALAALVGQGRYGTKTGAGFFSYTPEARERLLIERDRHYAALAELLEQLSTDNTNYE